MIKRLSECLVVALALLIPSCAKADTTFTETCGYIGTNPATGAGQPTLSDVLFTCAPYTIMVSGDELISVEMVIENSFSEGVSDQTNTVQFTYSGTGFDAVTSRVTTSTGTGATDAGAVVSEAPGSTCKETMPTTVACFEESPVGGEFTMTVSSSWLEGGTTTGGSDGVGIEAIFTEGPPSAPTPEPSCLTLLGSGLLILMAMAWRHKRLA